MRIGIDTNIWISKFFFDSNTFKAVFDIVNKHILIMPENVLDEILTKTFTGTKKFLFGSKNHKLGKKDNKRLLKIEHVRAIYDDCMSFKPNVKLYDKNWENIKCYIRDNNDKKILQSFIGSNCDILITGDKDFLNCKCENLKITTPNEFIKTYLK